MKEIYVSTDIEADGPIPGPNSMLSFGSVAFDLTDPENPVVVGEFSRNLVEINGSSPDPTTMSEFWDKNPEAWAACHENQVPAVPAMLEYACAYLRIPFTDVGKRTMPKGWFDPSLKHTHQALDDAHEQGIMFARMRAANLRLP
jgi:hypothetical protein